MENPRNTPRLETPRLILRRFVPEDAPALWELLRDREVNRFLPWFPVETLAEAEKFLRERVEPKKEWVAFRFYQLNLTEPPHPLDRGHRRVIFHSGGSLVWKKAGCAKGCGAVDWAEISVCGEAGAGQRFERWALRNR